MAWRLWWPWGDDEAAEVEPRRRRMTGGGQRGRGFWDGPVDPDDLVWFPGREVRGEPGRGGRPSGAVSPDVPYAVADGVPLEAYRAALEVSTGQCGACWGTGAAEDQLGVGDRGVIPCDRCDGTGLWQGGLPDPGLVSDAEGAALAEQTLAEEWPAEDEDEAASDEDGEVDGEQAAGKAEAGDGVDDSASESDEGDDADEAGSSPDSGDGSDADPDGSRDDGGWGDDTADGDAGDDGGTDGVGGSEGGDASSGGGTGQ